MVAPNGAYKTKNDHPNIPVTAKETVDTALACYSVGAHGIHTHVRDEQGQHCLDAGRYLEVIQELHNTAPEFIVQITTEAVGRFSPLEQREVVNKVKPRAVSVAVREMLCDGDTEAIRTFYHQIVEQNIDLQHILYSDDDVLWLDKLIKTGVIPPMLSSSLFVLGRYSAGQLSSPDDLQPFLTAKSQSSFLSDARFMVCAFGPREIECLVSASIAGSDCRIGFENNLYKSPQHLASSNQERVSELKRALESR